MRRVTISVIENIAYVVDCPADIEVIIVDYDMEDHGHQEETNERLFLATRYYKNDKGEIVEEHYPSQP